MGQKTAIFKETDQLALLGACESDNEFIPIWLMMRCGMHPSDVSNASKKVTFQGKFMFWGRVKNQYRRREIVPDSIRPRLDAWLKRGKKLSREGYFHMVGRVGERVDHPEYSPMSLRHTFAIQELRRMAKMNPQPPDPIALLAQKMGCTKAVAQQNYLDLQDWERLGEEGEEELGTG